MYCKIYLFSIIVSCILLPDFSTAQNVVTYTAADDIIANPERGFYKYTITDDNYNAATNYTNLDVNELKNWRNDTDKITVIHRNFLLNAFSNAAISARYLNNIQQDFNIIRNAGFKCLVRFYYSESISAAAQQPNKARILQHIGQLAPVLNNNKDIILSYEAGYIGTWGEWYYTNSSEFGDENNINTTQWQNRKQVVDSMLSGTPASMHIQLRTPWYKQSMYGTTPLNSATAYQPTYKARVGFFNDSFLNSWGDLGTFSVNSEFENPVGTADYIYLSNETQYVPMTGESSGMNAPRTNGSNAITELELTNWSVLNRDYYTPIFTNWINSGHYKEISKRMGYRISLLNSTFLNAGDSLHINIVLKNTGFARPFKERNIYLLLKNTSTNVYFPFLIDTDFRTWADTIRLIQKINLSELPAGEYTAYLKLPDTQTSLSDNAAYSVRMANDDVWIDNTGINDLKQTFTYSNISTYTFNGSGNWTDETNWMNNQKPPAILPANKEIIIDPVVNTSCILNTPQHIASGAKLTVVSGKHFLIQNDLIIQYDFKMK